jgi:PAS domain S-box-containing protein
MSELELALPSAQAPPRAGEASRDLFMVAIVTGLTFALSAVFEVREWMTEITRPLEHYQIDELPLTFAALALSLAWFSWRRWRHAEDELALRVAAQRALGEREAQFRTLFMENLAGTALASAKGDVLLCNPAMARILGLTHPDQAVGRGLADFYADRKLWEQHREGLDSGQKVEIALLDLVRADGSPVKAIARMQLRRSSRGRTPELLIYLADISELQLMQKELADTLAENRLLSQKYLMVQEDERRNLARELHDELGQCLNAIKLDAVAIRDLAPGRDPEIETSANAIVELSAHVYDVVRNIMQRLRPPALDALGLHDAVGHLVGQWQRRNRGVDCRFVVSGDISTLGEVMNITVYRLVQECLTNIAKHAKATRVSVSLERILDGELLVTVRDDGCGMELQAKRTGLGLVGLRERVEALHGALRLTSMPGKGLEVLATLPVPAGA